MSECIVRMEMPISCFGCPLSMSWMGKIRCVIDQERREGDLAFRPDWCPILCSLPEGHGRLVDADALERNMFAYAAPEMLWDRGDIEHKIGEMPSIVPAMEGEKK